MAFLRSSIVFDPPTIISGQHVRLRTPLHTDYRQWADLRAISRDHLVPWEPKWSSDELTKTAFRRRLRQQARDQRDDLGYSFFIFDPSGDALIGGLTLGNARRGVTQAISLGYWIGLPYARRGYMTQAVRLLIPHVFDQLRFHRIEAATMPTNHASIGVLRKVGFRHEGRARRYLKIDGQWQDHELYALLSDDPRI